MPSLADLKNYAIPVGTSIIGGLVNRRGAANATNSYVNGVNRASGLISGGAEKAAGTITGAYNTGMESLKPYQELGANGVSKFQEGLNSGELTKPFKFDAGDLENDPGYQFRLAEGNKLLARRQASSGSLSSGAALKQATRYSEDQASQEYGTAYNRAEGTFRANQKAAIDPLEAAISVGQNATNQGVAAGSAYGANMSKLQTGAAEQLAELETQKANAEAAGNIEGANSINGIIQGISSGITDTGAVKKLNGLLGGAPGTVAKVGGFTVPGIPAISGASAASLAPIAAPSLEAVAGGAVPALPLGAIGGATTTGAAGTTAGTTAGSGGLGSTTLGLLSNPITIGIGAGIIGITALLKSQAHWEANDFVQKFQNPFGQQLGRAVDGFNSAAQSGQLSKAQATQVRQQVADQLSQFEQKRQEFARGGSDKAKVAMQAKQTMDQNFGPSFSKLLSDMDATIARLQ